MRITRLGQGVDATGRLDAGGDRAHASPCCASTATVMDRHGVERGADDGHVGGPRRRRTATSSSPPPRRSSASRPELLSGDEEGRLSFRRRDRRARPGRGPFLVVDIGGGSTEFVVGTTEPEGVVSVDIGCVRLTEKFLALRPARARGAERSASRVADDLPRRRRARAARRAREAAPARRPGRHGHHRRRRRDRPAPSTTATASTTSSSPASAAEDVFRTLATEPRADRVAQPRARGRRGPT